MTNFTPSALINLMEENGFTRKQMQKMLHYADFFEAEQIKMNRSSIDLYFNNPKIAFNMVRCHREDNGYYNTTGLNNHGIVAGLKEIWSRNHTEQRNDSVNIGDQSIKINKMFIPLP